jgi:tetratricopeptide (TPR) repeat protein
MQRGRQTAWWIPVALAVCVAGLAAGGEASAAEAGSKPFDQLAREAVSAREAHRREEAARLYKEALAANPAWAEGWWYLGTLSHDLGRWAEGREAFGRFIVLKPQAGAAWALLGLCDFRLEQYDAALESLRKGLAYGVGADQKLNDTVLFHLTILLVRAGRFDLADIAMRSVVQHQVETPLLARAVGLLILRMSMLPRDISAAQADLIQAAGHAGYLAYSRQMKDAADAFRSLLERYPTAPHLHEAYGRVLVVRENSDEGLTQLRREIELYPESPLAHYYIAAEMLKREDAASALKPAETAVRLAPRVAENHRVLGEALAQTGSAEHGIAELETAVRLDPESAESYYALARAYVRAGRKADADRARAKFSELDRERRALETPP